MPFGVDVLPGICGAVGRAGFSRVGAAEFSACDKSIRGGADQTTDRAAPQKPVMEPDLRHGPGSMLAICVATGA